MTYKGYPEAAEFQFQTGSIKSETNFTVLSVKYGFNSKLVRLKDLKASESKGRIPSFNSKLVRLKVRHNYEQ